jgi:tol-pal system protein YbgF
MKRALTFAFAIAAMALCLAAAPSQAQLFGQPGGPGGGDDLSGRIGRLEAQLRSLTGQIEELQHRNQQLEQQLKRALQDTEFRLQEMQGRPSPAPRGQQGALPPQAQPRNVPPMPQQIPPVASAPNYPPANAQQNFPQNLPPIMDDEDDLPPQRSGRRGDVFDPNANPNAPGAPRPLGSVPGGNEPPARRQAGAPMDLGPRAQIPSGPPPGPRGMPQEPIGQQATLAPSGSPKDEYDLAVGAMQRRDYDLADQSFRTFLANHPNDRMVPEAQYWLGESQFQRKQYNDAAETFLEHYNKFPNSGKAPDGLLRLGQSLAALGKNEAACASLGAVLTKYPKASANVKKAVEQEQKRARC